MAFERLGFGFGLGFVGLWGWALGLGWGMERFSKEERELLDRHLDFYYDLFEGKRVPTTTEQKEFLEISLAFADSLKLGTSRVECYLPKGRHHLTSGINQFCLLRVL